MFSHGAGGSTDGAHAPLSQYPRWLEISRPTLPVAAAIALAFLSLALGGAPAGAQASRPGQIPDGSEIGTGTLYGHDPESGAPTSFPLEHTEVDARVSGRVVRVTVEQRFRNPHDRPIEAVYIFPLPHEAAVNDFEMRIGERRIRGEIHERSEALAIYEQARRNGQVAALLDQERPNIFTQSIANIMPGNEITVRLVYVENLETDERGTAFVFPTVVGPRYIPGRPLRGDVLPAGARDETSWSGSPKVPGTGWSPDTDRVPDASRITPPVLPPGRRSGHDIGITVHIEAGVPLGGVRCESHAVNLERQGRTAARVALRPSDTIPNKDFVLRWNVAGKEPQFGLLTYRDAQRAPEGFFALQFQPQEEWSAEAARPKEMIFLLDTSGSMNGEPLAKVKSAIRWALQNLNPDDRFQIIRFSDTASSFARRPVPGTAENVSRALEYLETLRGGGGTEMRAGIEAALRTPATAEALRLVFFMTDGYIGNEEEILATVRRNLGDARIFAFGVGSSVNRFLLDRVAEEGRGSVDYVSLHEDTRPVVERFYDRIARPYLTDIQLEWQGLVVTDLQPQPLPDLFAGQPLVLMGRYTQPGRGTLVVKGLLGRERFERRIPVTLPERALDHEALAVLWARRRIARASSGMLDGNQGELQREITALALQYRLVSAYTSFVAVDNQVVNEDGEPVLVAQPVPMPEGVHYETVFGKGEEIQASVPSALSFVGSAGTVAREAGKSSFFYKLQSVLPNLAPRASAPPQVEDADRIEGARRQPSLAPRAGSVELEAEALSPTFQQGATIEIRITLHNQGSVPLQVPTNLTVGSGTLWVMLNGSPLLPEKKDPSPVAMQTVAPGASRTWTVRLDAAHFAVPGRYRLVLQIATKELAQSFTTCTVEVR